MEAFYKSFRHTLEIALVGAIVLLVLLVTEGDESARSALLPVIAVTLGSFVPKAARSSKSVPVPDYVNGE